jgi:glucuronate isomerase
MNHDNLSVASLADEVLQEVVQPLPVVDVHTHINGADPSAHDISEIIFYHYIVSELEAAGVSRATLEGVKSPEEKVDLFLKFYKQISNTITFWCLRRVLELHGVSAAAELNRNILLEANAKVQASHADASWPRRTLFDSNRVRNTALTLNVTEKVPAFESKTFFGTLRLDDLVGNVTAGTVNQFAATTGSGIGNLAAFEKTAGDAVSAFAKAGGRALTFGLPPEEEFVSADANEAGRLFARVLKGEQLSQHELDALHSYLIEFFARLASEAHLPLQLLLGVRRPLPGSAAVAVISPGLVSRYAPVFHEYRELNFDLFLASAAHSQEAVATAKSYPNLSLTGFWWYGFSPPYIRAMLTERLMALPAVKLHAFFSDAYNVEWSAGKLALLRRELSRVLAELMVSHYISESQACEIANYLLHQNATRLYRL